MYPLPIIPLSPSSHNLLQPNANLIDPPYSSFTADGIVFCERYEYFAEGKVSNIPGYLI